MLYLLGVLVILLGMGLSIGLHELGHFTFAKLFNVKVTQFMIGFGPTIWSRKGKETEYGLKLLPLGGYVALIGMYPPKAGEHATETKTGLFGSMPESKKSKKSGIGQMIAGAREASAESIGQDDARAFYRLSWWKKTLIMFGGPVVNLILGFVFYAVLLVGIGVPQYTTSVGSVSQCLATVGSKVTACDAGSPVAPAAAAGVRPGDKILEIDKQQTADWQQIRQIIAQNPNKELEFKVERAGQKLSLRVTPAVNQRAVFEADGRQKRDALGNPVYESVGMIGATPASEVKQQPVSEVPVYVADNAGRVAGTFLNLPKRLIDVVNAAFGSEKRDPNGPVSVVGVGRMAGEITSLESIDVRAKISSLIGMLAGLNVALFVFNLIPLLPLDGGHIVGAVFEGARRGIYRLLKKPDPGFVDTAKTVPLTMAVAVILGIMTVLLVYADIVKPVTLGG